MLVDKFTGSSYQLTVFDNYIGINHTSLPVNTLKMFVLMHARICR